MVKDQKHKTRAIAKNGGEIAIAGYKSAFTLVKAHLGYTIYPDVTRAREPGLRYIPVEGFPRMSFGLYYRYDNDHPVMKRFLKMCEEAASE